MDHKLILSICEWLELKHTNISVAAKTEIKLNTTIWECGKTCDELIYENSGEYLCVCGFASSFIHVLLRQEIRFFYIACGALNENVNVD